MLNIFEIQNEFIDRDPRTDVATARAFTAKDQLSRFQAWVPPADLKDKSVLDIGCCLAAFGGYALSNGAKRYVGLEISEPLAAIARENLTKYYIASDWEIVVDSCEHFFDINIEHFNYILVGGVLHGITDFFPVLKSLAEYGDRIVIESVHPPVPFIMPLIAEIAELKGKECYERFNKLMLAIEYSYPAVVYSDTGKMMYHDSHSAVSNIVRPSLSIGALKIIMNRMGFKEDIGGYIELKKSYPEQYGWGKRFIISFIREGDSKPMSYSDLIDNDYKKIQDWKDTNAEGTI